jgi:hypothetical protein
MKIFFRHLVLCALPLACGVGAGYGFTLIQGSCSAMVGPIFSAKCHGRQREYQIKFQLMGAGAGTLIAATLGTWLEHRRRRAVQRATPEGETS